MDQWSKPSKPTPVEDMLALRTAVQPYEVKTILKRLGLVAEDLMAKRDDMKRKQGGVTPAQLQELWGTWHQSWNDGFSTLDLKTQLGFLAELADTLTQNTDLTVQEFACAVQGIAFHIAHMFAFDLFESMYENLDLSLEDATTRAKIAERDANNV